MTSQLCELGERRKLNSLLCDFAVKCPAGVSMAHAAYGKELHSQISFAAVAGRQALGGKTEESSKHRLHIRPAASCERHFWKRYCT